MLDVSILDVAILSLLLIYSISLVNEGIYPQERIIPFYYFIFFIAQRFFWSSEKDVKAHLVCIFSVVAPIIILSHLTLVSLQFIKKIPSFHSTFNYGSTLGNPDMLGTFIAVLLPFCFVAKGKWKALGYLGFLSGLFLLIYVQARSSILSIVLTGIIWGLTNYKIPKLKVMAVLASFATLLSALILWHPPSVTGRIFIWYVSLQMIIKKPLGWGFNAFDRDYPLFQSRFFTSNPDTLSFINPSIDHSPFNEFLHVGVCFGIVGLLMLFFISLIVIKSHFKHPSIWFYPVFTFLVISCFYFTFYITPVLIVVIICTAILANNSFCLIQFTITGRYKYSVLLLIPLLSIMFVHSIKHYTGYKKWMAAIACMENSECKKSDILFGEVYPLMKNDGRFLMTYAVLKLREQKPLEAIKLFEDTKRIFIEDAFILKLGNVYEDVGNYHKALSMYNLASTLAPDKFYPPYHKILLLEKLNRKEEVYIEAVKLYNKEVNSDLYADPYIIKSEMRAIINKYQK